jgi:RHS repeat-associated protein
MYSPYGEVFFFDTLWHPVRISLPAWKYFHQGGRLELLTELYYFRNRDFSSKLHRWTEPDPQRTTHGSNLYIAYKNNPLIYTDFYGKQESLTELMEGYAAIGRISKSLAAEECTKWATEQEAAGSAWLKGLPDCPCQLGGCSQFGLNFRLFFVPLESSKAWNPDKKTWEDPSQSKHGYHPKAKWCMRSKIPANSASTTPGQQCCYDSNGKLLNSGESAGTPDKVSPGASVLGHRSADVTPFNKCKAGGMLHKYFEHRRPNRGINPDGSPCAIHSLD